MKEAMLKEIDNIIFDLGNVIIRLDINATDIAFQKIFGDQYKSIAHILNEDLIFNQYEKGEISSEQFYSQLAHKTNNNSSTKELRNAWNAMLLDIPESRYELLEQAKQNYRTFCLSNTNETHIDYINEMLVQTKGIPNLNDYFEKIYLSHEVGMRKPDVEIFKKVIDDNQLKPSRTLFIDDTVGHLEGAKKAGLKVLHLTSFQLLDDLFSKN